MSWRSSERGGLERDDMSGRCAAAALRWSTTLLLLAAAACRGSDFMSGASVPEPGTTGHIVVDVRWDFGTSGQPVQRAIWLSPPDVASAAWQRIELDDDPDDKGAAWLALCNSY